MTVTGWRFRDPEALVLLALVLAAALAVALRERRAAGGVLFPSLSLLPALGASWRIRLRWLALPLRVLAATLLVVALARPQVGHAAFETVAQGIDIVLAIDTSSSMSGNDLGGRSKLEVTKGVIREFLGGLKDHRVGIVLFSGEAMILSPLTLDYEAARRLVAPLEPGKLLRDGTAIGTGLATSVNVLRESQSASRVIVLLTDGMQERNAVNLDVAAALADSADLHPPEVVHELGSAILRATGGDLQDDATMVCLDWYGGPPRGRNSEQGADPDRASGPV